MLWGTTLESGVSGEAFAQALERHGFSPAPGASPIAGLSMFDHVETGHRVIFVARTGRIQIRLDPLTRHEDRVQSAASLYEQLLVASREAVANREVDANREADNRATDETRAAETAPGA